MSSSATSGDILHDFTPILRHYKDGRIERLMGAAAVPPSLDPTTGVQSKDVQISPDLPLSARLYLPKTAAAPATKLPLLFYFHGGAFLIESAFSSVYQKHLNLLTSAANVVAVSVEYRLAPENPLPAAFDDAWTAVNWAASDATDDWIKRHGDFGRVYLGGDSAGGNIAHNIALRFGGGNPAGINLVGMFLNCPFFSGKDPIGDERSDTGVSVKIFTDKLWFYACPGLTGLDEAWVNPSADLKVLSGLKCGRVLVYTAGKDYLKDRGRQYTAAVAESGWGGEIEAVEVEEEGHVFSVLDPEGEGE
ncbi:2-hydroxyisoflavanone dehydratase-like [Andrographis paniculata]|uniref:2-hydroxyisoflavanone dehydratase-like n=1 Tax=Andrographis paniculata TaxID=175694 RepID=UPI0021E9133A|nr:2-hydroxyisoflavanone dehydratase-like [Andrographis paniculata]